MKTYTITLHCTDNAGSSLQAYALQHFLLKNNIENIIIDYEPNYIINYGNFFKRIVKNIVFFKDSINTKRNNKKFMKRELSLTEKKFKSFKELCSFSFECDCLIAGSDQIWNSDYPCGKDPAFYLQFDKKNKKVAYAASVGRANLSNNEINQLVNNIHNFSSVSFREKNTVIELSRYGVSSEFVCDPVFLLERENYLTFINKKPPLNEKYIVVYLVKPSKELDELVDIARKNFNCKVILIYGVKNNCFCDQHIRSIDPYMFLNYLYHSEYVICGSFHATAFSIIFGKKFGVVLPKKNQERIINILSVAGLEDRIYCGERNNKILLDYDYGQSYNKIQHLANHSKEWILQSITKKKYE